jgi:hypothetical protein
MQLLILTGCIMSDPTSEAPEITLPSEESENDRAVIDGVLKSGEWEQISP